VESDEDGAPECILYTENWLNWNSDFYNPIDREDDFAADDKSNIYQNNGIEDLECPDEHNVSALPHVP
jgi:hypothetical protein